MMCNFPFYCLPLLFVNIYVVIYVYLFPNLFSSKTYLFCLRYRTEFKLLFAENRIPIHSVKPHILSLGDELHCFIVSLFPGVHL